MRKLTVVISILSLFISFGPPLFAEDKVEPVRKAKIDDGVEPSVGKGDFRVGVMGSFQKGRFARQFFAAVSQFTVDFEFEYFVIDRIAPITRLSTSVVFIGDDTLTDLVWGAGIKGVFNFGKRYLPYIKFIPSVHFFNVDSNTGGLDDKSVNFDILAGVGMDVLLTNNVAIGFAFHYEVIFSGDNLAVYSFPFGFSFYF